MYITEKHLQSAAKHRTELLSKIRCLVLIIPSAFRFCLCSRLGSLILVGFNTLSIILSTLENVIQKIVFGDNYLIIFWCLSVKRRGNIRVPLHGHTVSFFCAAQKRSPIDLKKNYAIQIVVPFLYGVFCLDGFLVG